MTTIGRFFIAIGLILVAIGVLILVSSRFGFTWRLPGDIFIRRRNLIIYFPVATMLFVSIVLTIVMNIFFRK